jgi:hypothetical protein
MKFIAFKGRNTLNVLKILKTQMFSKLSVVYRMVDQQETLNKILTGKDCDTDGFELFCLKNLWVL